MAAGEPLPFDFDHQSIVDVVGFLNTLSYNDDLLVKKLSFQQKGDLVRLVNYVIRHARLRITIRKERCFPEECIATLKQDRQWFETVLSTFEYSARPDLAVAIFYDDLEKEDICPCSTCPHQNAISQQLAKRPWYRRELVLKKQ